MSRGGGKTSFIAAIGEATLTGPLIEENAEAIIVAPSLGQARITFNHVKRYMGESLEDKATWRVWDNAQMSLIEHKKTGQVLRCLGSEPKRLHGWLHVSSSLMSPPNSLPMLRKKLTAFFVPAWGRLTALV